MTIAPNRLNDPCSPMLCRGRSGTERAAVDIRDGTIQSPRVRGNPEEVQPSEAVLRSIPTRAGEPSSHAQSPALAPVYPRACGGTTRAGSEAPKLIFAFLASLSMKSSRVVTLKVLLLSPLLKVTLAGIPMKSALYAPPS